MTQEDQLTLIKYDSTRISVVSLSGKQQGTMVLSGKWIMFSMIRCRLGSSIKGDPSSAPDVLSTMMRISCKMERVDASPM